MSRCDSSLREVDATCQSLIGCLEKWIPRGSFWLDAELVADSRDTWRLAIGCCTVRGTHAERKSNVAGAGAWTTLALRLVRGLHARVGEGAAGPHRLARRMGARHVSRLGSARLGSTAWLARLMAENLSFWPLHLILIAFLAQMPYFPTKQIKLN